MADRPGFLNRLTAFLAPAAMAPTNGKHPPAAELEEKGGSGVSLTGFTQFVPNGQGTGNIIRLDTQAGMELATAYLVSAYAYVAMRYRAEQFSQPPLMVVKVDPKDGSEDWQPDHPAAPTLETPSPDYDMRELLYRTSLYVDMDGAALWVKDNDGRGVPGRLTPLRQDEFTCEPDPVTKRLRGIYRVTLANGESRKTPDQVIHFMEPNPHDWMRGSSRLSVAMAWLNLAENTRVTVRDLLKNAVWPSIIIQTDKEWNPDPKNFEKFEQQVEKHATPGQKHKALVLLGGGSATVVATQVKDILPEGLLNRVESVVASVFGIPAIVLQFQVGMENAPWSQMEEARRMCAEDTLDPRWKWGETTLTRQYLRPIDDDRTVLIKFDRSEVKGLQTDRVEAATLAQLLARDASLNERRQLVGLDPRPEPEADDIPALAPTPDPLAAFGAQPPADDEEESEIEEDEEVAEEVRQAKAQKPTLGRDAVAAAQQQGLLLSWQILADRQLETDRDHIVKLAHATMGSTNTRKKSLDDTPDDRQRRRFLAAVAGYLKGVSGPRWAKANGPMLRETISREVSGIAADLGIRFDLLQPELQAFVMKENAFLTRSVGETTAAEIQAIMARMVGEGDTTRKIASEIQSSSAFSRDRSKLIARTELGRAQNGAAQESIEAFAKRSGRKFVKEWGTAGDDRVRDEHQDMEGEQVGLNESFSNGLLFPSEPNCRCRVRYREVTQA